MSKNTGKYTTEDKEVIRKMMRTAPLLIVVAVVVLGVVTHALINDKIDFTRCQKVKVQDLNEIGQKIQYVLQHSTPGVLWLLFCVFYVVSKRAGTPAVVPTSGHEHLTESAKMIFLNSLEQFVMSFVSQLILVTYLTPKQVLKIIPVINILFITGRVTFWLGYPYYRSFGMVLNLGPLIGTLGFIAYRYYLLFV